MKSEFILAFNEICESRGLPKEDVIEALKTALVSAYRRDANLSNTQKVTAEIDPRTGEPTIFTEKEVVDSVMNPRTEVAIEDALRAGNKDAQMGDLVMMDSTTSTFGRIAAQTAKQVLLQRVREAEREHLFEDFSGREGELVNGTVQSISGQNVTIGLGRTEAVLPKSQQVAGERYRAHDKIRIYVLEVRRTSRGPQIIVSRNHRNLLRRLLELEVPEIYNGQVEIKSIAREAGQRSKVAVQALQPGVDPVGACVGMRGVRIQSIVRELNDEKIDVIEWDADQRVFIAKALSPARVSQVFLEEHPDEGKTAIVIVPDDQLSLAIGREGQNARLAAKLTGWRIDIKSLTEAAGDALRSLSHPAVPASVVRDKNLPEMVTQILDKKSAGRPITSEDYHTLDRLVAQVEGNIIASRVQEHERIRKQRAMARRHVPMETWKLPLDDLDLPGRIHNLLLDNKVETVGDVLYYLELGDEVLMGFKGFGLKMLETMREVADRYMVALQRRLALEGVGEGTAVVAPMTVESVPPVPEVVAEVVVAPPVVEAVAEPETAVETVEVVEMVAAPVIEEVAAPELVVEPVSEVVAEPEPEPEPEPIPEPVLPAPPEAEPVVVSEIDDLSRSLVEEAQAASAAEPVVKPPVVVPRTAPKVETPEEIASRQRGKKGRQLVFNEEIGEVVTQRKRKGSRRQQPWEDYDMDDNY